MVFKKNHRGVTLSDTKFYYILLSNNRVFVLECGKANSLIKPEKRIQSNIHIEGNKIRYGCTPGKIVGQGKETHSRLITQKSTSPLQEPMVPAQL